MTSKTIIPYGGTFERSTDGSTWSTIPEVKGLGIPVVTTEYLDVTNNDSPNGFREFIPGLKDAGEFALQMNYTSDGYDQMLSDQNEPDAIYYRTTMRLAPDQSTQGDRFEFRAFPTPELQGDDIAQPIGISVNLRMTGAPTFTKGS